MSDTDFGEFDSDFGGEEIRRGPSGPSTFVRVKVWNPQVNPDPKNPQPETPGLVINKTVRQGETKTTTKEVAQTVRAVILYKSRARQVKGNIKSGWQPLCQSHDGIRPSARVDSPFCRQATAADVTQGISSWKGYDQVKITTTVGKLTDGTQQLQFCGLAKEQGGAIPLCPFAKTHPLTGAKAACQQSLNVIAYDLDRETNFTMELTGRAIADGGGKDKLVSPFFAFMSFLSQQKHPCFAYEVALSYTQEGKYYSLNVTDYKPIPDVDKRTELRAKAVEARDAYEKGAQRLSKEAYKAANPQSAPKPAPVFVPAVVEDIPFAVDVSETFGTDDIDFGDMDNI